MTLTVRIQVPKANGPYEAKVTVGKMVTYLEPGDELQATLYDGQDMHVSEALQGTKAAQPK